MSRCEWCEFDENEWLLFETSNWKIYLADVQDYVGRCILVLERHSGSISELNDSEWNELNNIIGKVEYVCKEILGAEVCNWSCLMNDFYKKEEPNPHLHIHVRPRYKNPIIINEHVYADEEFAHHYVPKKAVQLRDDDKKTIYTLMKKYLDA